MNAISVYIVESWAGRKGFAQQFLVNGLTGYAILVATPLVVFEEGRSIGQLILAAYVLVFVAWFIWVIVGNYRRCFRLFRSADARKLERALSVCACVLLCVCAYGLSVDITRLVGF